MSTLASMSVRLGIDVDEMRAGAARAKGILSGLGKTVAGLGIGAPAAAAVTAGVGGMAAAFATAGVAAKTFQLAVGPQMASVAEAAQLAEEAEKAAAAGAEDAAEKQKAYADALAQMPPHTRAMAKEFVGLKKDYNAWSDSLSSSTMPVFTQALQVARRLLPLFTPFVKEASKAFGEFVDEIDRGTQGKGLDAFAASMAKVAGQNLKALLTGLKNIGIGVGGVIKAFIPLSDEMSGGFEESTAAFAQWGQQLGDSAGFADFIDLARQGAQTLGALAEASLTLLVAVAPLVGITTQVALWLARVINAAPPGVVRVLAIAITSVVVAMKLYRGGAAAVAVANRLMASSTYTAIAGWGRMAAAGTAAYVRIAAAAVVNAARTAAVWALSAARATATWLVSIIRIAAVTVAQFVMMAARAIVWAATMAAQWLIAMGPVGWIIAIVIALVALIIANWDKIKQWTLAAWDWIWTKIQQVAQAILDFFLNWTLLGIIIKHWDDIWAATQGAWNTLVDWVKQIPGWLRDAFLNWTLLGLIIKHWTAIKTATVQKALDLVAWVRGLPGRISSAIGSLKDLLVGKGRDLIRGLVSGVKGMGGWLKSQLMSFAKSMIPGPIAKALGINSPSKLLADEIGHWLPPGIAMGAEDNMGVLDKTMAGLVDVPGLTSVNRASSGGGAREVLHRLLLDVTGADEDMKRLMRRIVKVDGGGSAEAAFGS